MFIDFLSQCHFIKVLGESRSCVPAGLGGPCYLIVPQVDRQNEIVGAFNRSKGSDRPMPPRGHGFISSGNHYYSAESTDTFPKKKKSSYLSRRSVSERQMIWPFSSGAWSRLDLRYTIFRCDALTWYMYRVLLVQSRSIRELPTVRDAGTGYISGLTAWPSPIVNLQYAFDYVAPGENIF